LSDFTTVAKIEDIQPGEMRLFRIGENRIVVARSDDGVFHAFDNACPHSYFPLIEGEIHGQNITCVYHRIVFNMRSGAVTFGASAPLKLYDVRIEGDEVQVGPRRAELAPRWGAR
jgi:nitrite reductase/ring-hydroxylating ferredoxin subunit